MCLLCTYEHRVGRIDVLKLKGIDFALTAEPQQCRGQPLPHARGVSLGFDCFPLWRQHRKIGRPLGDHQDPATRASP